MTNRDKINALSNIELAGYLGCDGPNCSLCIYSGKNCRDKSCTFGIKAWLDAPCANEPENPPAENVAEPQQEAPAERTPDKTMMNTPHADNEQQEAIPPEVKADLKKIAHEIIDECKKKYPIDCEYCRYGDHIGVCCFERKPITWVLDTVNKTTPHDNVNHPAHYTFGNIEVIDFIEDKELGFHLGNAVKYISRAGRKNPDNTIEDLRKAVWYINRQIQRLEGAGK